MLSAMRLGAVSKKLSFFLMEKIDLKKNKTLTYSLSNYYLISL